MRIFVATLWLGSLVAVVAPSFSAGTPAGLVLFAFDRTSLEGAVLRASDYRDLVDRPDRLEGDIRRAASQRDVAQNAPGQARKRVAAIRTERNDLEGILDGVETKPPWPSRAAGARRCGWRTRCSAANARRVWSGPRSIASRAAPPARRRATPLPCRQRSYLSRASRSSSGGRRSIFTMPVPTSAT